MSYPVFLKLEGKRVLIVGGGSVATEKGEALAKAGALLRVVAPAIQPELASRAEEIRNRVFQESDLDDVWLVVSAAPPEVNRFVREAADRKPVFVVAVDDVQSCTAIGAARLDRDGITIAISSDGKAPALVALLRRALDAVLPPTLIDWMETAERERAKWLHAKVPMNARRPLLLRALNELYGENEPYS